MIIQAAVTAAVVTANRNQPAKVLPGQPARSPSGAYTALAVVAAVFAALIIVTASIA